jgi:antibiotic biosynthesis monooxygenase (ABM) superfamily enzyme
MLLRQALGEMQMPTDSLLLLIAVCLVFLLFAVVVAWVDHSTSQWLRAKAAKEKHVAASEPPHRKAA